MKEPIYWKKQFIEQRETSSSTPAFRPGLFRNLELPLLVSWKYKWITGAAVLFFAGSLYLLVNHFPLFQPILLPLTWIDHQIPFLPWTIWIYTSGAPFFIVVYWLNRCVVSLNAHLYSFLALIIFSNFLFLIFPTTYPRELFPIPDGTPPLTSALLESIRWLDEPHSCAPSLHVSIAFLIAFGFLDDQQKYFKWVLLWAILLALSTLTTKQHYAFDVLSGFLMATFFFHIFHRRITYRFAPKGRRLK